MQPGLILVYGEPKCYRQRRPLSEPVDSPDRATLPVAFRFFTDSTHGPAALPLQRADLTLYGSPIHSQPLRIAYRIVQSIQAYQQEKNK
jgi:hypothetical protein